MSNAEKKSESIEFLLREFDNMEAERARVKSEAVQRLNFFLTITSGILGGIALFGQYSNTKLEYLFFSALLFLSVIGWQTFDFMIGRDINVDRILRAIGRIRRYFADNDPAIISYLSWQTDDEPSSLLSRNKSAVRRTTQSILAFLLALAIGFSVAFFTASDITVIIISGIASFFVLVIALEFYATNKFKAAAKEAQSKVLHPKAKQPSAKQKRPT